MEQLLVISAMGANSTAITEQLTRAIADCSGNIKESRMATLGSDFGILLLVAGNWHTISRLERELEHVAKQHNLSMQCRRTDQRRYDRDSLPYAVDVVGLDQPGIVNNLSSFFSSREVEVSELSARSYAAAQTETPMFSVQMFINIPSSLHISALREEFMEFCDQLNVDAIMEPVKHG